MIVENFFKRCNKCTNYHQDSTKFMQGICLYSWQPTTDETICPIPKSFAEKSENYSAKVGYCMNIKFGDLLPLIKCEFVVEYKGEIYHSFGNTLQSVLREHFKDLTVRELTTYDEECLKVVIK